MHTLTWIHTRKRTPMTLRATLGQLMVRAWMVRAAHPSHPMKIDGRPI